MRMEGAEDGSSLSASMDDSLADFKSPRIEPVAQVTNKLKILNEKRAKRTRNKTSSGSKKKEAATHSRNQDGVQPSIEASFFKAAAISSKDGYTCPLCMKYFADASLGTVHSKNCAAKNHVSTKKLLTAVALQKRQADERLAIGLPAGPFVQPRNKTPRRPRESVSDVDAELQLALALSKSLQENEMEQQFEEALLLATEHRGDDAVIEMTNSQRKRTLKNFGFSSNKPTVPVLSEGTLKARRRKHLGPTVLQTRSQETRDRLLSDRIAEVLMGNEAITQISQKMNDERVEKPPLKLRSRLLNEIHRTTERLWDSAQLPKEMTNFYVENLGPAVTAASHHQPECLVSEKAIEKSACLRGNSMEANEKITPVISVPADPPSESANVLVFEMSKVHVTDREYRNSLPGDWSNILNVSTMSDLVIIAKGNRIWVHKLVLHVRCSDILLDGEPIEDNKYAHVRERVCWPDVDFVTAIAFLEFVYSGVIEKNGQIFHENRSLAGVRRLARKYRLKNLFDYLRKKKAEMDMRREMESRGASLRDPIIVDANEFSDKDTDLGETQVTEAKTKEIQKNCNESDENAAMGVRDNFMEENSLNTERSKEILVSNDANRGYRPKVGESQQLRNVAEHIIGDNKNRTDKIEKNHIEDSIAAKIDTEDFEMAEIRIKDLRARDAHIEESKVVTIHTNDSKRADDHTGDSKVTNISVECPKKGEICIADSKMVEIPSPDKKITQNKSIPATHRKNSSSSSNPGTSPSRFPSNRVFNDYPLLDEGETERMDVFSVESRSDRAGSISPDLFDETLQASFNMDDSANESPGASQESSGENAGLEILAKLVANDASSTERSEQIFAPIRESDGREESTGMYPEANMSGVDFRSRSSPIVTQVPSPAQHNDDGTGEHSIRMETPKNARPRYSQRANGKSNLSLFIEKVQKINSKAASDSCTDEESLAAQGDRRRFRNPFNLGNASNRSIHDCNQEKKAQHPENANQTEDDHDFSHEGEEKVNQCESCLDSFNGNANQCENYVDADVNDCQNSLRSLGSLTQEVNGPENSLGCLDGEKVDRCKSSPSRIVETVNRYAKNSPECRDVEANRDPYCLEHCAEQTSRSGNVLDRLDRDKINVHGKSLKPPDEESNQVDENFPGSLSSINDTFCIDDEDVSIYSKYKRANKHNSIANYRDMLNKFHQSQSENETSENERCTEHAAIDLTQESDEDPPANPSSSVHPRTSQQSTNRILDMDSNNSMLRNIDCAIRPSHVDDNKVKKVIGDERRGSRGSQSQFLEMNDGKKRAAGADVKLDKDDGKAADGPTVSLVLSDLDVFEIDEEMFAPISSGTSPGAPSSRRSPRQTVSSANNFCQPGENTDDPNGANPKAGNKIGSASNHRSSLRSSKERSAPSTNSSLVSSPLRNSPDSDVLVITAETLRQNPRNSVKLSAPGESETPRTRRISNGMRFKVPSGENSWDENDDIEPKNLPSRRRKSPDSSPEYAYSNSSQSTVIFAQCLEDLEKSPKKFRPLGWQVDSSAGSNNLQDNASSQTLQKDQEYPKIAMTSPNPGKSGDSCDFPEVVFFENQHEIFTESFRYVDEFHRATTPVITRQETPGARGAILVSSSPEMDRDLCEFFAIDERDSNKENSVERNASPVEPKYDGVTDRFSPLSFEEFQSPRTRITARELSLHGDRRDSCNSVKKLMTRSISMPESTVTSEKNCKKTRTPRESAKIAMSRELTPPRNYDAMDTPELKRELDKYGIKPQKRKRARQLLNHIYNELHRGVSTTDSRTNLPNDDAEPPLKKIGNVSDCNFNDSDSNRDFPLSQKSVASEASVSPEETEFPDADISPKGGAETTCIREAFAELLRADKMLHNKVLTYEPLAFEALHSALKAQGLKCKQNDLIDFLDEECIAFQVMAQTGKSRTRKNIGKSASKRKKWTEAKGS